MSIVNWLLRRFEKEALEYAAGARPKFAGETARQVDDIYGLHWYPEGRKYNPDDLASKKGGLSIYKKMRDDDQVKSALHLKKSAIIHPGYDITGKDAKLVDYVKAVLDGMQGTFDDTVRSILSAYEYGFSLHEKVYQYIEAGPFAGKIGIESIRQKSPTRIEFDADEYGRLKQDGIIQKQQDGTKRRLDRDKFILHSYQKEFDNYYGESDLKAAYRFWFLKVNFFRYWGMYLEKFAIPIVLGKVMVPTINEDDQAKFRTIVSNIQAGMGVVTPKDLEIDFKEAARSGGGTFQSAIEACDIRIARAVLLPTLLGLSTVSEEGSFARAQVEESTFDLVLSADSKQVAEVINEQLIRPLVVMNFGVLENYPRFSFRQMREEDRKSFVVAWADAVSKNAVTRTPETEEHIRYLLGFPKATRGELDRMEEEPKPDDSGVVTPGKGDGIDKKLYVLTTLNAQEARKAWKDHVDGLDELEEESKTELSDAFSNAIQALVVDAKKNSPTLNG